MPRESTHAMKNGCVTNHQTEKPAKALAHAKRAKATLVVAKLDRLARNVAFLSALTNVRFTAVQYAIFSSLMTLLPKVIGGYSGTMVDNMGYGGFFLTTALMGLPVIALIVVAMKVLTLRQPGASVNGSEQGSAVI